MPLISGVTQENIHADGHVIGGNYNKTENNNYFSSQNDKCNPILASLYKKYEGDSSLIEQARGIVEELSDYFVHDDTRKALRDLSEKLNEGNRAGYLEGAKRQKQLFRRKIERYRHSHTAQLIFVFLLGLAKSYFNTSVYHKLGTINDQEIDELILECVVERISMQIPASEPLITHETIYGMLYFLTGNCFVEWKK